MASHLASRGQQNGTLLTERSQLLEKTCDELPGEDARPRYSHLRENSPPRTTSIGKRGMANIIICTTAVFFTNITIGSFPLMVPVEIRTKGYPVAWIGILNLVFGCVFFLSELVQPKLVPAVGTKRVFVCSAAGLGATYIAFGCLQFTSDGNVFGGVGCLLKALEAFGYAGLLNAMITMLCVTTPDKAVFLFGITDGMIAVGFALGPLISGGLYEAAGFTLSFVVLGVVILLAALLAQCGLPHVHVENSLSIPQFNDVKPLFKDIRFMAGLILLLATAIGDGYLEATQEIYFSKYHLSVGVEGAILFAGWFLGAVASLAFGWILNRWHMDWTFLFLGPIIASVVFAFFGPLPGLETLDLRLGLSIFCFILIIVLMSVSLIAAAGIMLQRAELCGLANDMVTYTYISAIWLAVFHFGEGMGEGISAAILNEYDYQAVTISFMAVEFGFVAVAMAVLCCARKQEISNYFDGKRIIAGKM